MMRFFAGSVALVSLSLSTLGQVAPRPMPPRTAQTAKVDEAKAKADAAERLAKQATLAEQVLIDVQGLRLADNRALVYARAGGLLWKTNRESAQDLFQRAVNDLGNAQLSAEADESKRSNQADLRIIQNIRPNILTAIANFDAEFALEALYRTRTASIQKVLAMAAEPPATGRITDLNGASSQLARSEFSLEQRLLRLAAEQNPERAAKLLQDTIRKGLSNETLSLLKKLFEKDPELANSLAAETLDKLLSATFSSEPTDQTAVSLSYSILNDSLRVRKPDAKELKLEESALRSLANKLINFAMSAGQNTRYTGIGFPQLIKIAEKYSPAMVAALKKVEKSSQPPGMSAMVPNADSRKLLESNLSAPQLIAEAKKLPLETRAPVYQNAANKLSQSGDYNAALELLNANFSGRALENAVNSLNWFYASHLMNQGKWSEAERLIDQFPDNNKRSALITLATKAFAKDPTENKSYAISVLAKVRGSLSDKPGDQMELSQIMQLAAAYAPIDADEAFNCIEPIRPMLNELVDANAVVQGFQNGMAVRSGEFVLASGGYSFGFVPDMNLLKALAKADFERTLKFIEGFTRPEMRINLRLQLAESGLN